MIDPGHAGSRGPSRRDNSSYGQQGSQYARDREGRILRDRYGRPVQRRAADPGSTQRSQPPVSPSEHTALITPSGRQPGASGRRPAPAGIVGPNSRQAAGYPAAPQVHPAPQAASGRGGSAHPGGYHSAAPRNASALSSTPGSSRRGFRLPRIPFLRGLLVALLILTLIAGGAALWVDSKLTRVDALGTYPDRTAVASSRNGTNWLLVGSDSRAGLSAQEGDRLSAGELSNGPGRTDTIMIVHIPSFLSSQKEATVLSLPRDSYVDIPGQGKNKLNAAFTLGGPQLLQETVERATGIKIDRYVEIGFGGFSQIVDAVDGINLCLNEPLKDPMAGIDLQAGCQIMDGPTALGYVRSRYASATGDLARVDRQKEFLSSLASKVSSPATLLNPLRSFRIADSFGPSVTVNSKDHIWNLASLALGVAKNSRKETVPVAGYSDTGVGNVVLWDEAGAEALFAPLR